MNRIRYNYNLYSFCREVTFRLQYTRLDIKYSRFQPPALHQRRNDRNINKPAISFGFVFKDKDKKIEKASAYVNLLTFVTFPLENKTFFGGKIPVEKLELDYGTKKFSNFETVIYQYFSRFYNSRYFRNAYKISKV